jgi:hypothetical protein
MELVYNIPDLPISNFIIRTGPYIETEIGDFASVNFISGLKPRGVRATDVVLENEICMGPLTILVKPDSDLSRRAALQ